MSDPLLGPLADNGGPTLLDGYVFLTHRPLPVSQAVDAGDRNARSGVSGVPLFDARGNPFERVVGKRIDIGAVEFEDPNMRQLLVDTLVDESDGDFSAGDLSLREAIDIANNSLGADAIRFDPALTVDGPATIQLKLGELKITDDVSINDPNEGLLTIDASDNDATPNPKDGRRTRIFNIDDAQPGRRQVLIGGLRLTGGDVQANGGAIFSAEDLLLANSIIEHNAAFSGIALGRGIYSTGVLDIENCQIVSNLASGRFAHARRRINGWRDDSEQSNFVQRGWRSLCSGGEIEVSDSLILWNSGGGLEILTGGPSALIVRSTFFNNSNGNALSIDVSKDGEVLVSDCEFLGNLGRPSHPTMPGAR